MIEWIDILTNYLFPFLPQFLFRDVGPRLNPSRAIDGYIRQGFGVFRTYDGYIRPFKDALQTNIFIKVILGFYSYCKIMPRTSPISG